MAEAPKAFIEWLNEELRKRNWSQNELANESGLTSGMISRVLSGQRPGLEVCKALAKTLDMKVDDVLEKAGHLTKPPGESRKSEVLSKILQLSDDDIDEIVRIAELKIQMRKEKSSRDAKKKK